MRNLKVYIVLAVVVVAMGFLVLSGFNQDTMMYYSTIEELLAKGDDAYDRGYRVSGTVVEGSVVMSADNHSAQFAIQENGASLRVSYEGILPDTFKEGVNVLIEGKMRRDRVFQATNVLTKCASKYDPTAESEGTYN